MLQIAAASVWGFLAGFVGWGACFRLPGPVAMWLLEDAGSEGFAVSLTALLVTIFFIFAVGVTLSLVPLISAIPHAAIAHGDVAWRDLYGASFLSSLVGLFALLGIRRIQR